eukprot:gene9769-20313_t
MSALLDNSSRCGLGIDLGGSHISVVIVELSTGTVLEKYVQTVTDRSIEAVNSLIISLSCKVLESSKADQRKTIVQCGLGIPGNVDPLTGCARYLPNFGWMSPVPIGGELSEKLGFPVNMRNDGRCAAIAESKYGVGKSANVFAMLTLGTGIGGALIINNKLFDGSTFDAGDFGHHVICSGIEAFDCVCGKRGCFEYQASADGLLRHYKRQSGQDLTKAEHVIDLIHNHDENAILAFTSYKNDLATGLANLITFYNPDVIALGGGLSQAPEIFEGLEALVNSKTLPATRGSFRIMKASLGTDAGAIGAAILENID